jgi:hypothetical protein
MYSSQVEKARLSILLVVVNFVSVSNDIFIRDNVTKGC